MAVEMNSLGADKNVKYDKARCVSGEIGLKSTKPKNMYYQNCNSNREKLQYTVSISNNNNNNNIFIFKL